MNPEVKKNLFLFVYYLIGALIIIGLLFFAFHSAHAEAAYYFQSDKSGTFTYSGSGSRFTVNIPGLGSSSSTHVYVMMWFKGTNTVKEEAGADTLDCNVDPNICLYSYSANGVYDSPTIFVNPSSTVWNTTGTTEGIFSAWYNIGRGNVWTLSTSTPVIFTRSTAVGTGNDTQTFYTGGDWSFTAYGNAAGTLPYLCVADSYANVIANCNPFAPPPPTPPTLSITYPVSGSLYQYAPSQILLTASPFTSVGDTVKIFYGVFGAGVQYTDVYPIQNDTTSSDWIFQFNIL